MVNKIFGVKNITHLLYGIIVLLPMMAILGRVCYTVVNKNAFESYTTDYEYKETLVGSFTPNVNQVITLKYNDTNTTGANYYNVQSNPISNISQNIVTTWNLSDVDVVSSIQITSTKQINVNVNGNWVNKQNLWGVTIFDISFTLNGSSSLPSPTNTWVKPYTSMLVNSNSLDNAFEYSLKTFTEDNNLGEVDMFSWFTDLFLDHSNAHNQIYIGFVNWYLNYTMLVSCGYLFFLVLIWFINFIRRILDKSMYQDYGGF